MRDSFVSWKKILAESFTSSHELLKFLELPIDPASAAADKQFKTRVPYNFAARMQKRNPRDPLLLQVLATDLEMEDTENYKLDPLKEAESNYIPGLIHKYKGRVLITFTGICAINCRYCFRRHFPYQDNNPGQAGWKKIIDYLQQDETIYEVILSGGDPLLASDKVLETFIEQLETVKHIKILRFHTRIPVVLPERITEAFLQILQSTSLHKVIVLHCNHAQELDNQVKRVCQLLSQAGCHLLNQSVLLKGVNNHIQTLVTLSKTLFDCGILPYYLHLLDKVSGAAHFDLPLAEARTLYLQLQSELPGYLVPKLVYEEPGKANKTLIT
ncbi:EF-P beta-lysylation protein EpmB [Legionella gresilensis]|uniref:EF-P beta-lysylation protein EpmB n=1 Tax=Legionella gresilensis TaxID=91823 RepID=UPI001041AC70|nr:EF-P beta-lysylation protein EpmB [Legionella gresilensis]